MAQNLNIIKQFIKDNKPYILILVFIFILSFGYVFQKKIDLSGDNIFYYTTAKSISEGKGFTININSTGEYKPTRAFPPFYPMVMSFFMLFNNSIIFMKILNGIFILMSSILLIPISKKITGKKDIGFITGIAIILNSTILGFTVIIMAEPLSILLTLISILFIFRTHEKDKIIFYKNTNLYILGILLGIMYLTKSSLIPVIMGIIFFFFVKKKWKEGLLISIIFYLVKSIYSLRNSYYGLNNDRYITFLLNKNGFRPEEGDLSSFSDIIERIYNNFETLISKGLVNNIMPHTRVVFENNNSVLLFFGILIITITIIGILQSKKYLWLFLGIFGAIFSMLLLWNANFGGGRYIITSNPLIYFFLFNGLYTIFNYFKKNSKQSIIFIYGVIVILFFSNLKPGLDTLRKKSINPYNKAHKNYIKISKSTNNKNEKNLISCRKPFIFGVNSNQRVTGFAKTKDNTKFIKDLIKRDVDYVILDQLGYSSTYLYLYPAVKANNDLFQVINHIKNPDTYLLKFLKDKAKKKYPI